MNPQIRRLILDLGPLLIFFAGFKFLGIFGATAVFMVAVFVALGLDYALERRLSPMPIFTAVLVLIFGGLTLYLKNDMFIKMKPTVAVRVFRRHPAGRPRLPAALYKIRVRASL